MGTKKPISVVSDYDFRDHELANTVLLSPVINTGISGTAINDLGTDGIPANVSDASDTKVPSSKAVRQAIVDSANQIIHPDGLVYGYAVWSGTGLIFNVTECRYYIGGIEYVTSATQVTLSVADATLSRIDVIYVDDTGTVDVLIGIPNAAPAKPSVDPFTQIELTFITINALDTTPTAINQIIVYDENTEWTGTNISSESTLDLVNTTTPYSQTKCIKLAAVIPLNSIGFRFEFVDTAVDVTNGLLIFNIRLLSALNAANTLMVSVRCTTGTKTLTIGYINSYGFNFSSINWQKIVLPLGNFGLSNYIIDKVLFAGSFTGSTVVYFDKIELQTGIPTTIIPTLVPVDDILQWDNSAKKYVPYGAKKSSDPGYPYLYISGESPTFTDNILTLDGMLKTGAVFAETDPLTYSLFSAIGVQTHFTNNGTNYVAHFNPSGDNSYLHIKGTSSLNRALKIRIGEERTNYSFHNEYIDIDDYNRLFDINFTNVRLNKGTASKYIRISHRY